MSKSLDPILERYPPEFKKGKQCEGMKRIKKIINAPSYSYSVCYIKMYEHGYEKTRQMRVDVCQAVIYKLV
jgi:hypothetical protein